MERLAKDRGVNSDVTSETIQKQQESLKLISSRLGLKGEDILTVESAQGNLAFLRNNYYVMLR